MRLNDQGGSPVEHGATGSMALPEKILSGIQRLEPLPITMQRLLECLSGEDLQFGDMVNIVEHDQAVASNILRAANSSFYAGRIRITQLRSAMVRLGKSGLLEVALGGHLRQLSRTISCQDVNEDELWLHGAVTSLAVRSIISACPDAGMPWNASVAGLVHDIGKLIMLRYLDIDMAALRKLCEREGITPVEAERDLIGCDHAQVGERVARQWGFPQPVTEAIGRHHESPLERSTPLLDAVVTADCIVKTIGVGLSAESKQMHVDQGSLDRLGLSWEGFCRLCAETVAQVHELKEMYGISS